MKNSLFCLLCLLSLRGYCQDFPHIIPKPLLFQKESGSFTIKESTQLVLDKNSEKYIYVIENLKDKLSSVAGVNIKTSTRPLGTDFIAFKVDSSIKSEAYSIKVTTKGIELAASQEVGFFYAYQSLLQMLPADIAGSSPASIKLEIPACSIKDEPRFGYRGQMLDVGRHYFPLPFIKKVIDQMAQLKLNVFHWHLTEDQGWRIEIKKYPKLTEIGSIRKKSPDGHYRDKRSDGKVHQGFYTQDEVRELVEYAAKRHITVIPEIEMPGHSLAALASYPELGCGPGPYEVGTTWGIIEDVYCPSENTFTFLKNVLTEVMDLFPSKYIHIGGDECPKKAWKESKFCQDLIRKEGLKNEDELQSYFIKRIDAFVSSKGRRIIGWDEILEGGLSPNATVMSWRGMKGGIEAAEQGHDVVVATTQNLYFDYYQAKAVKEPIGIGGFLDIEKVYSLEPIPKELKEEEKKYIIGVQAQLWTEYIHTSEKAEYMLFPRILASAEVAWASPKKDFPNFKQRVVNYMPRLQKMGINYCKSIFDVDFSLDNTTSGQKALKINSSIPNTVIRYTLDGSEPNELSFVYSPSNTTLLLEQSSMVNAATFDKNGKRIGRTNPNPYNNSLALQKKYTLSGKPERYLGSGPNPLTDGIKGYKYDFSDWVGFFNKDVQVDIDLGNRLALNKLELNFLSEQNASIYLPSSIEILFSDDGQTYKSFKKINQGIGFDTNLYVQSLNVNLKGTPGRYIRLVATNLFKNDTTKSSTFIMLDEITIN
ncbi:MAG: glycoside hydrolase family 20 protein [Leadbetterella sp.]